MSDADEMSDTDSNSTCTHESYQNPPPPQDGPYLEILEQPQSRGFRFRYACEGKSHGGLQGVNSRREKKSFPTVKINRYKGPAKIIVSLVTDGKDPKPHAHEMIGKNCQNGICSVTIKGENMTVSFPNLGIRHVTKKSVTKILTERIRESLKVDKMMSGEFGQDADHIILTYEEEEKARKEAELQAKTMPLSVVRLRFQAYLQDIKGMFSNVLAPIISSPIYDSKAPCASILKICRMDKVGGSCTGNEEVFLLCDKVQKDDIAVRFYEQDEEGNVKWEDYGNFAPHDVHRQYAIVFRTPSYMETNIDRPVAVHVQLKRFSDGEVSDPKTFTYYPQQTDLEDIQKKRKKQIPNFGDSDMFTSTGGSSKNFGNLKQRHDEGGGNVEGGRENGCGNHMLQNVQLYIQKDRGQGQQHHFVPSFGMNLTGRGGSTTLQSNVNENGSRLEEDACPWYENNENDKGSLVSRGCASTLPHETFLNKEPDIVGKGSKDEAETETIPTSVVTVSETVFEEKEKIAEDQDEEEKKIDARLVSLVRIIKLKSLQTMTKGLQSYATTGDTRFLIAPGRHLISIQNDDGDNCLHLSIIHQQSEATKNLLSVMSLLTDQSLINEYNERSQTPLYLSVATKQIPLLKMLLSSGADYTVRDKEGNTFLHIAAQKGYKLCLEEFLNNWNHEFGPTVNDLNYDGFSALHLAVFGGHLDCVKLLLSAGVANVNLPDARSGRTALHHAVDTDNLAIVGHLILESNANVNQAAYDGNTPLHMAATSNKLGIAALLMAADADPDAENMDVDSEEDDDDDDAEEEDVNVDEENSNHGYEDENDQTDGKIEMQDDKDGSPVGKTPKDIACGNPKMLRILNGEQYSSVSEKITSIENNPEIVADTGMRLKSVFDSGISGILSFNISAQYSHCHGDRGDLHELDPLTRTQLAKLLDPLKTSSDWRELAEKVGLGALTNALQLQTSPTRALLDNFEVVNGTCERLKCCLLEMGRSDAIRLIDEVLPTRNLATNI